MFISNPVYVVFVLTIEIISLLSRSGSSCRVNSLLELWSYNESIIRNLTSSDILDAVNAERLVR